MLSVERQPKVGCSTKKMDRSSLVRFPVANANFKILLNCIKSLALAPSCFIPVSKMLSNFLEDGSIMLLSLKVGDDQLESTLRREFPVELFSK